MSENSHIEELIIRYLLKEINEDEMYELETWIQESPENKEAFFRMKNISDSLQRPPFSEKEKEDSWQRMRTKLKKQGVIGSNPLPVPEKPKYKYRIYLRYAAAVVLAFGIGWGVSQWVPGFTGHESEEVAQLYNEVQVERGGRGNSLILSDGTRVTLNTATSFRYPTGFNSKDRTVYLDGEAYFEVTKDESRPFIVKLRHQDITVLGTSFNVEAYSEESNSIITLSEGKISLQAYNEKGDTMSRMFLNPGQQAVSDNATGSVSLRNVDVLLAEAWKNGEYKFKDEPLISVAKRLERYYNLNIHIETESLKQIRYTGTFSINQDIEEVLNIINNEKKYKVEKIGDTLKLEQKTGKCL